MTSDLGFPCQKRCWWPPSPPPPLAPSLPLPFSHRDEKKKKKFSWMWKTRPRIRSLLTPSSCFFFASQCRSICSGTQETKEKPDSPNNKQQKPKINKSMKQKTWRNSRCNWHHCANWGMKNNWWLTNDKWSARNLSRDSIADAFFVYSFQSRKNCMFDRFLICIFGCSIWYTWPTRWESTMAIVDN